jgi:hypothetical protein
MAFCKQSALEPRKTNVIKFIARYLPQYPLNIAYNNKHIEEGVNSKFLGLENDNHINRRSHIDQLFVVSCMQLDSCCISAILTLSEQFILLTFTL